jgi:hypothetical protein
MQHDKTAPLKLLTDGRAYVPGNLLLRLRRAIIGRKQPIAHQITARST